MNKNKHVWKMRARERHEVAAKQKKKIDDSHSMTAGVQIMQTDRTGCPRNKRCEASRRYCENDWLCSWLSCLLRLRALA